MDSVIEAKVATFKKEGRRIRKARLLVGGIWLVLVILVITFLNYRLHAEFEVSLLAFGLLSLFAQAALLPAELRRMKQQSEYSSWWFSERTALLEAQAGILEAQADEANAEIKEGDKVLEALRYLETFRPRRGLA